MHVGHTVGFESIKGAVKKWISKRQKKFKAFFHFENFENIIQNIYTDTYIGTHFVCSKKKILGVESRDLSQTDTILTIVSSFLKLNDGSRTSFPVSQQLRPELFAK